LERLLLGEESRDVREFYVGLMARFLFSALIDADRLSAAGRSHSVKAPRWDLLVERLERHISGIEQKNWVDEIRSEVSLACREFASREKGLYLLTVPTGGAKTLSSLRFGLHHAALHQMDRLVYVIPYTSIIDQNAAVARSALEEATGEEKGAIVLEHHSNLTPEKETWQSKLLAENWDATVIFTTTVQFLETLFGGSTRGVRRMHNLANTVIIFDEIQTLPIKTVHMFNNAVNFMVKECGSTVVFCTATQPLLHNVDPQKGAARLTGGPEKSEMAPRRDDLFKVLHRVEVLDKRKNGGWTESEITQCICDEARESGSALAIVNTKVAARALYDLCKQQIDSVYHLSTNMCPVHRMEIINDIKRKLDPENPEPKVPMVCVSTQLIEAGVDVDFGSVVRYLAGLDSIAQAAGRCNRNGRRLSGKVLVVNPSHESLDRLPEIRTGREIAERVLDEYRRDPGPFDDDLLSPKAMQRYYEYYFFNRAQEMGYRVSSKDIGHDDELLSLLSTNPLSIAAYARANKAKESAFPPLLKQSFRSAGSVFKVIDAPTEGIIVPYGEEGREIISELCAASSLEQIRRMLKEAQRYSVNLYHYDIEKLMSKGAIHETQKGSGIFYLDEQYYDSETMGVVLDPKAMGFLSA
jgi:CRISPR-associated endonuclease/helicase Cas3